MEKVSRTLVGDMICLNILPHDLVLFLVCSVRGKHWESRHPLVHFSDRSLRYGGKRKMVNSLLSVTVPAVCLCVTQGSEGSVFEIFGKVSWWHWWICFPDLGD